jgi:beta-lactamase superfamily II metal-dependent hydrolase
MLNSTAQLTLYVQAGRIALAAVLVIAAIVGGTNPAYSAADSIVINEVELNPAGTDMGFEMVELFNPTSAAIDVDGWTLSSTAGRTREITIGGSIAPGAHALYSISQQWLDNENEAVVLKDSTGAEVDRAGPLSDTANDARTWQRSPDGSDNWVFASLTIGQRIVGTDAAPPQEPSEEEQPAPRADSGVEVTPEIIPSENLTITFIDVGQGDSILIILPNTKTILIDGGERQSSDELLSMLQDFGITRIDLMIATHPHADHIGGLIDVINSIEVGAVMDSGQVHTTQTFEDLLDAIESEQVRLVSTYQGAEITLDPTVQIDVLNPLRLLDGADDEEQFNENSVVIKLTYGEFSALFTGDMEQENEARLVQEIGEQGLDADVLKAGHHGSRTSSTAAFLEAVSPEVVVISAGADNTYGHPHEEALDRIAAAGAQHVFRTDLDGTIVLTSDGLNDYTIGTAESNKTVVVPEFEVAIIIAAISLVSVILASRGRRLWRPSGLA